MWNGGWWRHLKNQQRTQKACFAASRLPDTEPGSKGSEKAEWFLGVDLGEQLMRWGNTMPLVCLPSFPISVSCEVGGPQWLMLPGIHVLGKSHSTLTPGLVVSLILANDTLANVMEVEVC